MVLKITHLRLCNHYSFPCNVHILLDWSLLLKKKSKPRHLFGLHICPPINNNIFSLSLSLSVQVCAIWLAWHCNRESPRIIFSHWSKTEGQTDRCPKKSTGFPYQFQSWHPTSPTNTFISMLTFFSFCFSVCIDI